MEPKYKEIISLDEYESLVNKYRGQENIFYRGQGNKNYNISCSLSRDNGYVKNEDIIISKALKERNKEFEGYKYPIEQLSKMQHYQIPTRLIDVTIDPLTALYFAVENTSELEDAEVFIFKKKAYELHSKKVNLISILAITNDYNIDNIITLYKEIYKKEVNKEEAYEILKENKFVEFSKELSETNERLYGQQGTFIICSNKINDSKIENTIKSVSKYEAAYIVRVPFEYKSKIKEDLELRYNINQSSIYPELPNFANYIREKYKAKNSDLEGSYTIIGKEDVSHALTKRVSIKVELNKRLDIEKIKEIVKNIIRKNKKLYDVIWIYVSASEEDTIMYNWTVSAQWINDNLDSRFRFNTIGNLEDDNIYWKYDRGVNSNREWHDKNVFEEDDKLLQEYSKELEKFKKIYLNLKDSFKNFNEFKISVNNYKYEINSIYLIFNDLGKSRNREVDKFLQLHMNVVNEFHNIIYIKNYGEKSAIYLLSNSFERIDSMLKEIDCNIGYWTTKINRNT